MANCARIKIDATQVAAWLRHCENSLDFLFRDDTPDLGVIEALQGPPHLKICDPIGGLDEPHVMNKVVSTNIKKKIMMSNTLPGECIRKYYLKEYLLLNVIPVKLIITYFYSFRQEWKTLIVGIMLQQKTASG